MSRCLIAAVITSSLFAGIEKTTHGQEAQGPTEQVAAIPLVHVEAAKAAEKLKALLGRNTHIVVDEDTNTVFVRANADKLEEAKKRIKRLDVPSYICIVAVHNVDAGEAATVLRLVMMALIYIGDDRRVHIVAVDRGNMIVVASHEKAKQVRNVLSWLDVKTK